MIDQIHSLPHWHLCTHLHPFPHHYRCHHNIHDDNILTGLDLILMMIMMMIDFLGAKHLIPSDDNDDNDDVGD